MKPDAALTNAALCFDAQIDALFREKIVGAAIDPPPLSLGETRFCSAPTWPPPTTGQILLR